MEFPRMVFNSPGPEKCDGGTIGWQVVENDAEYAAALKAGFSATIPEALEAVSKAKLKVKKEV